MSPAYIVSTDLDGTLLDHYSYSWEAAIPSINMLQDMAIPIIINTSKTFAEVNTLQAELGLHAPFIVENGSAIYVPDNFSHSFNRTIPKSSMAVKKTELTRIVCGCERHSIVAFLQQLRSANHWQFESYSDWNTQDIMQHTGLNEDNAKKSQQREFSEPLLWHDSEENLALFIQVIANSPFRMIKGGRFIHILGKSDKGAALQQLQRQLAYDSNTQLICLGDSHNDLDMLTIADIPVFIRSPVHDFPGYSGSKTPLYTTQYGPKGWHEAFTHILND
jgi:mannosyl-3-phosphoglycerate phosphatase